MALPRPLFALLLGASPLFAATIQKIAVNQVDLYQAGKLIEAKSHIGIVDVTYTPDPTGVQWINIVQTPASGTTRWLVRNLILLSQAHLHASTYRISRYADLLVASGTNLSGTTYSFSYIVTAAPLTTMPTANLTSATATVAVATMQINSGLASAPASFNAGAPPAAADPLAPPPAKEETKNNDQTPVVTGDPDMGNVVQGSMQCVPGAMANSMQWLAKKGKIKLSEDPKKTLADLAQSMSTDSTAGTQLDTAIGGLSTWAAGKSIPLNIEFQTDGAYQGLPATGDLKDKNGNIQAKGRGAPNWEFIFGEKQKTQDVFLVLDRLTDTPRGKEVFHHAVVLEWAGTAGEQRTMIYRDDPFQHGANTTPDEKAEIDGRHESLNLDDNGNLQKDLFDSKLRAVIAESPVLAETSAIPAVIAPTFVANQNSRVIDDQCRHNTDPVSPNALILTHADGSISYLGTASAGIPGMINYLGNGAMARAKGAGMYRGFNTTYEVILNLLSGPFGLFGTSTTTAGGDGNLPGGCGITSQANLVQGGPYNNAANANAVALGDPVSSATGELFSGYEPDLALGGPLPLNFRRYYGSMLGINDFYSALGNNWMHNFDKWLTVSGSNATAQLGRGRVVRFRQSGTTWSMLAPDRYALQLINANGGYKLMDPEDRRIYTFSAPGALTRIEDRNGNALTITQAASGNGPTLVSDGLGRSLTFTYTGNNLTQVKDHTGRTVTFAYNTAGNLTKITDAAGNATSFTYTQGAILQGLITGTTLPAGNVFRNQTYDSFGRVSRQTDAAGNTMAFAYSVSAIGGNTDVTDALSNTSRYAHDNLISATELADPYGITALRSYDRANRLTTVTDRLGNQTAVAYHDPTGYPASFTDALGNTTTLTWTAQTQGGFTFYNLTKIAYADGSSAAFNYDASGNVLTQTDRAAAVTTFTYNAAGQPLTLTSPTGGITTFAYNKDGTLASRKSAAGDLTSYEYDTLSRRTKATYADASTRTTAYDSSDRVAKITDERGKFVAFAYDKNGNLASVTDRAGSVTQYAYDTNDRLTTVTDAAGKTWKLAYDARSMIRQATNGEGETVVFARDALGRVTSLTDPAGKASKYTYDRESGWISAANPLGNSVSVVRDAARRIVQLSTPQGESFLRTFDKANRLNTLTDPLKRTTAFQYDAAGRLSQLTLADAGVVKITMDAAGNRTAIVDPLGNSTTQTFDKLNRLLTRTDALGRAVSLAYDNRNRLSTLTLPNGTATYTYDLAGRITKASYSDGAQLNYAYDDQGRLTSTDGLALTRDANGRAIGSNGIAAVRDGAGRVTSVTLAANMAVNYTYDARGLLSKVTDWAGAVTTFVYNDASQLIAIQRPNQVNTAISYDKNGRVAAKSEAMGDNVLASLTLTRDAAGQVVSADRNQPLQPDPAPGLTPLPRDAAGQVTSYIYDANGFRTSDGVTAYTWDLAGRMLSYTGANGTDAFTYDGLGALASRTGAAFVWNYAFPRAAISVMRSQDGASDLRYYVHQPNGRLLYSIDADGTRRWFHFDERGNTLMLTSDDGTIYEMYATTPTGESVAIAKPQPPTPPTSETPSGRRDDVIPPPNPFIVQGEGGFIYQPGTGLLYTGPSTPLGPQSSWIDPQSDRAELFLDSDAARSTLGDHFLDNQSLISLGLALFKPVMIVPRASLSPILDALGARADGDTLLPVRDWSLFGGTQFQLATVPRTGLYEDNVEGDVELAGYRTFGNSASQRLSAGDGLTSTRLTIVDLSGIEIIAPGTLTFGPLGDDPFQGVNLFPPGVLPGGAVDPFDGFDAASVIGPPSLNNGSDTVWMYLFDPPVARRPFRIADDESPRPKDRMFLQANYFDLLSNCPPRTPPALQGHPEK